MADVCIHTCTGCLIDDICYGDGQANPAQVCQKCNTSVSATAWSDNDGALCDDTDFCTVNDTCSGGTCGGDTRTCDDGVACTDDGTCSENKCPDPVSTCDAPKVCDVATDACVTTCPGCLIEGTCYGDDQPHPTVDCQKCDIDVSTTDWSPNNGAPCDDSDFCTVNDTCSGTTCGGDTRDCSDGIACTTVAACAAGGCPDPVSMCDAPKVCDVAAGDAGECVTTCPGCVIGEVCYGDGQVNPDNICQMCEPDTPGWSNNDFVPCDNDELFCNGTGTCSGGSCDVIAENPCPDDGFYCNGDEFCDDDARSCGHTGDPCADEEDPCYEALNMCCVPNVVDTDLACNEDGMVTAFDSCGVELVVEDCHDTGTTCEDGECVCEPGNSRCNCVLFVRSDNSGDSDGRSWSFAFPTVQEGIDAATVPLGGCAVWVKAGTYTENIVLHDNVRLYGGFAGTETRLDERILTENETILDAQQSGTVVTRTGYGPIARDATIDGFTITNGINSGMRIEDTSPTIANCRFVSNLAGTGGGIYAENSSFVLTDSYFTENYAWSGSSPAEGNGFPGGSGGAITIVGGEPVIRNTTFHKNGAGNGGNGVGLYNSTYFGPFDGGPGGHGGAIYIFGGSALISFSSFTDNSAGNGGAGDQARYGQHGHGGAGGLGGAIYAHSASLTVVDSTIAYNTAGHGGLGVHQGGSTAARAGNGGQGGSGGGVFVDSSEATIITGSFFWQNEAGTGGPAQYFNVNSGAGGAGGHGGGLALVGVGSAYIASSTFTANLSGGGHANEIHPGNSGSGGGIYSTAGFTTLANCVLADNRARQGGTNGDSTIHGNGGSGGGLYVAESQLFGCTIEGNASGSGAVNGSGGGVLTTGDSTVSSSILWNNGTSGDGPQIHSAAGTLTVSYSNVQGGYTGDGTNNIDTGTGPLYYDRFVGDLSLHRDSACINAGNEADRPADTADLDDDGDTDELLPLDRIGDRRLDNANVDMGAYEYQLCGDGVTDSGEDCDDGNRTNCDGCNAYCRTETCGNGVIECEEACDDGNTDDGDGCSSLCVCENLGVTNSCADIVEDHPDATDGVYLTAVAGRACPAYVYCDMTTDGGGWTMVLRLNSNDETTQDYFAPFWSSVDVSIGAAVDEIGLLTDDRDYLSPTYNVFTDWDEILLDYRYTEGQAKRMAAIFSGTNGGTFRSHAHITPDNTNPNWIRGLTFNTGTDADAANWYGSALKFGIAGDWFTGAADFFRIWYNQVDPSECNQAGGIGVSGDYGSKWHNELSFPSNTPGCQENDIRGTIGTNGGGDTMNDDVLLSPADAYEHGIMYVFVR